MGTGPTAAGAAVHNTNTRGRKYRTAQYTAVYCVYAYATDPATSSPTMNRLEERRNVKCEYEKKRTKRRRRAEIMRT